VARDKSLLAYTLKQIEKSLPVGVRQKVHKGLGAGLVRAISEQVLEAAAKPDYPAVRAET